MNSGRLVILLVMMSVVQLIAGQSCDATVGQLSCSNLDGSSADILTAGLQNAALLQTNFQLVISESDVNALPGELLTGYDITSVSVMESDHVTTIPRAFLSGITSAVTGLYLTYDYITNITAEDLDLPFKGSVTHLQIGSSYLQYIDPNSFVGYDKVTEIDVDRNHLFHLEPDTFTGLSSLTSLQIWKSHLTTVDVGGFGQLPALEMLAMQYSDLTFLQDGVFDGLPEYFEINIGGINFNCTCQLQWFKDWLNETNQLGQAQCAEPIHANFADFNFCGGPPYWN